MEPTFTTAKAAEIVSIGYEGFRSYLKRGLLGSSGVMPGFVHRDAPAPDHSRIRAKWSRFGFTDLCLIRLVKMLIDLGLSFDQANGIASNEDLRKMFRYERDPAGATLMSWPPNFDFIIFAGDDLRHLPDRLTEAGDVAIVIQLDRIDQNVRAHVDKSAA